MPSEPDDNGIEFGPDVLDCGTDKDKFIGAANAGLAAAVRVTLAGALYLCEATEDLTFKKRMVKLADSEPSEIKILLGGKCMSRKYRLGKFNRVWLDTIALGIEGFNGPLKDALMELIEATSRPGVARKPANSRVPDNVFSRKRILIIYHDSAVNESFKDLLEDEGFTNVHLASDCEAGLAAARRTMPDLIIIGGLHMPAPKDGLALCRLFHSLRETRTAKLMLVTGHLLQEYAAELLIYGVSVYIQKPFEPQKFIESVEEMFMEPAPEG